MTSLTTNPPAPPPSPARSAPAGRRRRVAVVAVGLVALLLSGCLSKGQENALTHLNQDRRAYAKRSLGIHDQAQAKAQAWAERLAREGRLYHSNLSSGFNGGWCRLAENVGYGSSTASIQDAFMRSSGHRANALSSTWNGVGIGVAQNRSHVYVVQVFVQRC